MKRFHVSLAVRNLGKSVAFYRTLFNAEPVVLKDDYAKWHLDDPSVHFSITTHGAVAGVDHIGIEAPGTEELAELRARLVRAEGEIFDQPDVNCCYARSTKAWIRDPDGVAWETFYSHGDTADYGDGTAASARIAGMTEAKKENARCC